MSFLGWIVNQYSLSYYTPFTTAVNVFVALVCLIFVVWFFRRYDLFSYISTNPHEFIFSLLGWVLFGVGARVMKDLGLVKGSERLLVITPFIYIEVLLISSFAFIISRHFSRAVWRYGGYILAIPLFLLDILYFHIFRWEATIFILLSLVVVVLLSSLLFSSVLSSYAFIFQMLDGFSTFISLTFYGFGEEHLLPNFLINFVESHGWKLFGSGAWIFLFVKFILVVGILKLLDKEYSKESIESQTIKIFMVVLGMAVGIRNVFNLLFI